MTQIVHGSRPRLAKRLRGLSKFPRVSYRDPRARFNWEADIFLSYPPPSQVDNAPANYQKMHEFYIGDKYVQWQVLREYFKTPEIEKPPYVVRPRRHEGGEGFEIVQTLPDKARERTHYWRSLWRRDSEYRVIFIRGAKALVLLKRVPEGTSQEIPWNAGVSSFVTVHEAEHDRLRHSAFYKKAEAFFKDYPFHFCAVDVLYRKAAHCVVEVNFSPGVMIPDNFNLITFELLRPHHAHITAAAARKFGFDFTSVPEELRAPAVRRPLSTPPRVPAPSVRDGGRPVDSMGLGDRSASPNGANTERRLGAGTVLQIRQPRSAQPR